MPEHTFDPGDVSKVLWLRRSNDRSNLHYVVRRMQSSKASCMDLAFLIKSGTNAEGCRDIKPFLVYCDSRVEAQRAAIFLRSRLTEDVRDSVIWVHSGMSDLHRKAAVERLGSGEVVGVICTDALGMVSVFFAWLTVLSFSVSLTEYIFLFIGNGP